VRREDFRHDDDIDISIEMYHYYVVCRTQDRLGVESGATIPEIAANPDGNCQAVGRRSKLLHSTDKFQEFDVLCTDTWKNGVITFHL
jgi:hypothetical protein